MTELSTEARALLALTRASDGPTDDNRRRVAQALAASVGVVGSSLVSPGAAAAAAKSAGTTAAATGVATGSSAAGIAAGGVLGKVLVSAIVGFGLGFAVAVPVTVVAQRPTEPPQPTTTNAAIAIQSPPGPAGTLAGPAQPPVLQRATVPEGSTPRTRASESTGLAREAELLASVQRELNAGRGRQALKLLDAHERPGQGSMLGPERAAARVLALCQVGDVAGARQLANEFLRSAPNSPVVPRIQRSCAFRASQAKAAFAPVTESRGKDH